MTEKLSCGECPLFYFSRGHYEYDDGMCFGDGRLLSDGDDSQRYVPETEAEVAARLAQRHPQHNVPIDCPLLTGALDDKLERLTAFRKRLGYWLTEYRGQSAVQTVRMAARSLAEQVGHDLENLIINDADIFLEEAPEDDRTG